LESGGLKKKKKANKKKTLKMVNRVDISSSKHLVAFSLLFTAFGCLVF
jgi:hypothetical protein